MKPLSTRQHQFIAAAEPKAQGRILETILPDSLKIRESPELCLKDDKVILPPPPNGYSSWLDFAIETMDSRSVELENLLGDDSANWTRDDMVSAARAELLELRGLAAAAGSSNQR